MRANTGLVSESDSIISDSTVESLLAWVKDYTNPPRTEIPSFAFKNSHLTMFAERKFSKPIVKKFPTYAELAKTIKALIDENAQNKEITLEEQNARLTMLTKLKKWDTEISSLEEINKAIQLYQQYKNFYTRFNRAISKIKMNSVLVVECNDFLDELTKRFKEYRTAVLNLGIILVEGYYTSRVKKDIARLEGLVRIIPSYFKLKPSTYKSYCLITKTKEHQNTSIHQTIQIYADYCQKNSIFYFHWRKHNKPALEIIARLKEELKLENADEKIKLEKARDIVKELYKKVGDKFGYTENSSFIRRSRFAMNLLDQEILKLAASNEPVQSASPALTSS